jgi:hypothetical protein
MDYQSNVFDKRARADIDRFKQKFVIDIPTSERLRETLVYLYLSQNSKNQRGVELQTKKLKNILFNCPKITSAPVLERKSFAAYA